MKKILIIFMAAIMLLSAATIVSAQKLYGVSASEYVQGGDYVEVHTNVRNTISKTVHGAKIVVYIPDLEIYEKSSGFYISQNMNYGRYMHVYVPEDTQSGDYLMRVSLFHDGKIQHQYRMVTVE